LVAAIDYTINDHITIAVKTHRSQCVYNILIALEEIGRKTLKVEEYDYQRAYFLFMDTSGLTGSVRR
jgi:hypothetical protein